MCSTIQHCLCLAGHHRRVALVLPHEDHYLTLPKRLLTIPRLFAILAVRKTYGDRSSTRQSSGLWLQRLWVRTPSVTPGPPELFPGLEIPITSLWPPVYE